MRLAGSVGKARERGQRTRARSSMKPASATYTAPVAIVMLRACTPRPLHMLRLAWLSVPASTGTCLDRHLP